MCMSTRPNVVVLVSDTFRRDHLGAFGNTYIHTPHIDEFARSSVVFDRHVISSFPTMPARADILTGTFSYTHMGWEPLPRHLTTLPGVLSKAGYHTMGVVDTPFYIRNGFGYDRGFDDFIWVRGQGDDTRPHERSDYRSTWVREEDRVVARTMTEAERWLERHYDEPFFLYVDTWDPHEPWDAPAHYTKRYRENYDGEQIYPAYGRWREAGLTEDDVELAHDTYRGEVTMVDFWIGRLLGKLDALGLKENTIVIFTSDHGFYFGEHDYFGKAEWVHEPDATVSENSTAVDSTPRKVASYMPITVTTRDRTAILGGPDDQPELYDLRSDPEERNNVWRGRPGEGESLCEDAIAFLEDQGTPEEHLTPRREALDGWRNPVELTG